MNWTRQKAYLTGEMGSYPTDSVRGVNGVNNIKGNSELSDTNGFIGSVGRSGSNYQKAYIGGMDGSMIMGPPDYNNQNNRT